METLTARVVRYQATGEGREGIERDVAKRVYDYPRRKCGWDEETSSEFFARVFPKVGGMIERFRDVGRPFESYLASMLLYQVRTYAHARRQSIVAWEAAADPEFWDLSRPAAVASPSGRSRDDLDPALREAFEIGQDGTIHSDRARRRFLVVCLKNAHTLSDSDLSAIARVAGARQEELEEAVRVLRGRSLERSRRLALFAERRNRAFSGLRMTDLRLAREIDPGRRRELQERRERLGRTLHSCQRTISRIRLAPTHGQIAAALGMPKASVDSTIYRLKRRLAAFYAPRHEEYA
jgi:hypothetical protein